MVLYQSLMYNICITFLSFATAVQWILYHLRSCLAHTSCSDMDLISLLSKEKPERNLTWKHSGLLSTRPEYSHHQTLLQGKCTGSLLVAHHDIEMGLVRGLCSIYGVSLRIWKRCCIHVAMSFPTLSPIRNFPLKFLYFDIIKMIKRGYLFLWVYLPNLFWSSLWRQEGGVVHGMDTGCKYWAECGRWRIESELGQGFLL